MRKILILINLMIALPAVNGGMPDHFATNSYTTNFQSLVMCNQLVDDKPLDMSLEQSISDSSEILSQKQLRSQAGLEKKALT